MDHLRGQSILEDLNAIIRVVWKGLPEANALAYNALTSITQTIGVCISMAPWRRWQSCLPALPTWARWWPWNFTKKNFFFFVHVTLFVPGNHLQPSLVFPTTFTDVQLYVQILGASTFSITTLCIKGLFDTIRKDTQHNMRAIILRVSMLSVAIYLLLCWESVWWMSWRQILSRQKSSPGTYKLKLLNVKVLWPRVYVPSSQWHISRIFVSLPK